MEVNHVSFGRQRTGSAPWIYSFFFVFWTISSCTKAKNEKICVACANLNVYVCRQRMTSSVAHTHIHTINMILTNSMHFTILFVCTLNVTRCRRILGLARYYCIAIVINYVTAAPRTFSLLIVNAPEFTAMRIFIQHSPFKNIKFWF